MTSTNELATPWATARRPGVFWRWRRVCAIGWRAFVRNWAEAVEMYARASGGRYWGPL
jgi:hypothetical protein